MIIQEVENFSSISCASTACIGDCAPLQWISSTMTLLNYRCRERRRDFYRLVVSYKEAQGNLVFHNQDPIDYETFVLDINNDSNLTFHTKVLVLLILHVMMR